MSGIKDFFTMTRNERRGTIVVLVLIALLLAGSVIMRSCHRDVPVVEAQSADLERFDAETDTAQAPAAAPYPKASRRDSSHRSPHHRHGKKPKSGGRPKPAKPAPQRMDPVPQF